MTLKLQRFLLIVLISFICLKSASSQQIGVHSSTTPAIVTKANQIPSDNTSKSIGVIGKKSSKRTSNIQSLKKEAKLVCPKQIEQRLFRWPCNFNKNCAFLGQHFLCCNKQCVQGTAPPQPQLTHAPLFGILHRECPTIPLSEIFPVQECQKDEDCVPRLCCPEATLPGAEVKSYCRTGSPKLENMPRAKQFLEPLMPLINYMQCSPPPPQILDIFPKECTNPLDCFPNLCCQEGGKKVCRPPRKSFLSLIAGVASRIGTSNIVKRFIQRIS